MLKILLTRHGETQYNVENRIQGNIDTDLTPIGVEQAESLAEYIHDVRIDYVISSGLRRAIHTAEIIARPRDIAIKSDNRLNERDWGRFNGKLYSEINTSGIPIERYLFYKEDPNDESNVHIPKNQENKGETIEEVIKKVGNFWDELIEKYREANLVLVGSRFSNAYLLNCINGASLSSRLIAYVQENMCINELRVYPAPQPDGKRHIECYNINFMEHVHFRKEKGE